MKRTIEYTSEETKTEDVHICDRCGLEAEDPHELSDRQMVLERAQEAAEDRHGKVPLRTDTAHAYDVTARELRSLIDVALWELDPLSVCSDCYDELFGWIDVERP